MTIFHFSTRSLKMICLVMLGFCQQAFSQEVFESLLEPLSPPQWGSVPGDELVGVGKYTFTNRGQFMVKGSSGLGVIGVNGANDWSVYNQALNGSTLGSSPNSNWILDSRDKIAGTGHITSNLTSDFIIQNSSRLAIVGFNSANEFDVKHNIANGTELGLNGWQFNSSDRVVDVFNFLGNRRSQIVLRSHSGLGVVYQDTRGNLNTLAKMHFGRRIDRGGWVLNSADEYIGGGDFNGNGKGEFLIKSRTHIGLIGLDEFSRFSTLNVKLFGGQLGAGGWRIGLGDKIAGIGDFNGDGHSDFIVQSQTHLGIVSVDENNNFYTLTSRMVGYRLGENQWRLDRNDEIAEVGDYDGDGRSDFIILSNTHIGIVTLDELGAFKTIAARFRNGSVGSGGWSLASTDNIFPSADFNGDGRDDVLLQKPTLPYLGNSPIYGLIGLLSDEVRYYNADDCLECSREQNDEVARVINEMMGIEGGDPYGDFIGGAVALKPWVGRNWYPMDNNRKILCGAYERFGAWEGAWFWEDERDWNIIVTPHENFSYLISDALFRAEGDSEDWHQTDGELGMEIEVTPPSQLNDYSAFSYTEDASTLRAGQSLCTYGPWVYEESHNDRPEIHPSELLWWEGEEDEKYMVMVQDGSQRFEKSRNYKDKDRGFRPWAAAPMIKEFKIAFNTEVGSDTEVYTLDIGRNWLVTTPQFPEIAQDAELGRRFGIEKDGFVPILVVETAQADPLLGVQFESVCYNSETNRLSGYIVVKAAIGTRTQQQYGAFLEIKLIQEMTQLSR